MIIRSRPTQRCLAVKGSSHTSVQEPWQGLQSWSCGRIWQESGTISTTKSTSVCFLHGCQGFNGCLFNTRLCEDRHSGTVTVPIPQRQGCWDESIPILLFDLVSPERMSFLLSAPQCSGKQGPGQAPAGMLI